MPAPGRALLSVVLALLVAVPAGALAQVSPGTDPRIVVKELAIQGHRRIQEAVILGRVSTKVGSPFSPTRLADDIRAIFALGYFDDVQMKVEDFEGGVKVTFVVVERPFIRDIRFAGQKQLDASALQEKIELKLGSVYNPVDVNRAADKVREVYEEDGYFEATVTPDVERLPDGDVTVVFRIAEGRRITIDQIVIEGAKGLRPAQIKDVMATQERQFWILRGTVQRQRLDEDVERIISLYRDHGYEQARVEASDILVDRDRARVTVRIVVVEGPQFRVGGVDVTGNQVLPVQELRRQILFTTGDVFSRGQVRDSVKRIADLYGTIGRASAEVLPNVNTDVANRRVNVTFEITEGPEVFIERINISGNTRSQEKILRRELPMQEGDHFTTRKLERARQKLVNLGYFDQVKATTSPGSGKDKIVVNIEVTEKPTGLFSIGGGFSSQDGLIGTLDLSQRNFLGRGWEVFLRIRGGANVQQGQVGFTEPWLFDRPLAAGFDLFNLRRNYTEYTVNTLGGNLRLAHPIGEYSRWNLIYRVTQDDLSDIPAEASPVLREQEGTTLTSLIGGGLSLDTRDNVYEPSRGYTAGVNLDVAGIGFGDSRFVRATTAATYYLSPWLGHVFGARVSAGYSIGWGGESVPLYERFYLGGANTLRGFKLRQVSPRDDSGTRIGGNVQVLGNLEYTVPLFFGLKAAAFYDVGQVYGPDSGPRTSFDLSDLRHNAGLGVRWNSPFGPLRADYGVKLDRRTGESFGEFHFSVGSPF
jgi:outer membrane protein insertion porin family